MYFSVSVNMFTNSQTNMFIIDLAHTFTSTLEKKKKLHIVADWWWYWPCTKDMTLDPIFMYLWRFCIPVNVLKCLFPKNKYIILNPNSAKWIMVSVEIYFPFRLLSWFFWCRQTLIMWYIWIQSYIIHSTQNNMMKQLY